MACGRRVDELARGFVPGGVTIILPYEVYTERVARTRQALDEGHPQSTRYRSVPTMYSSPWIS